MSYQKFTKDIGIVALARLAVALKGIIILPVITKLLGPENYGIWAQLVITLTLISPIAVLGLPYTLVRFLPAEKNKQRIQDGLWSSFVIIAAVSAIIALLFVIFSEKTANLLSIDKSLFQILGFAVIFECLNELLLNVFRAFQKMGKYAAFTIFQTLGEAILVIIFVVCGAGISGAVWSLLAIRILNFPIMMIHILKTFGFKIPKFTDTRDYLRFGLPTIPSVAASWFVQSSDRYLIGIMLGNLYVGYYVPAYIIGNSIAMLMAPLGVVLPAAISKLYGQNKIEEVKTYQEYSLKYFLLIAIPSAFGLSILAKQLLTILSTPDIAANGYLIVPFVAASMLITGIGTAIPVIFLKKKTHISAIIWIAGSLLNFLLNLIFIPVFGIMAAAVATLISYVLIVGSGICYCRLKHAELLPRMDWSSALKSVLAAILMSFCVLSLKPAGLVATLIAIIFGALIYTIIIFWLQVFSQKEITFLKNLIKISK